MKLCVLPFVVALVVGGCGGANGGPLEDSGAGGVGGVGGTTEPPATQTSEFLLRCEYDTLELSLPIEIVVEPLAPYSSSAPAETAFSASVTLDESSTIALLDSGISRIDVASAAVTTTILGATPTTMTSSLDSAPIDDLDLEVDLDSNGTPGPHRLELGRVVAVTTAETGARTVTFGIAIGGVSLSFGDFEIPADCLGTASLVGTAIRFPVKL